MAAIEDLVRYASENARSVQRLYDEDRPSVPVSAIALANVVEQLVTALTADGVIHAPGAGPSGPTTACGRDEQVYVVEDEVTCPECGQRRSNDAVRTGGSDG